MHTIAYSTQMPKINEAYCDCTGSPPWPAMMRLHAGAPNHYYLCLECGAMREDVYKGGAIIEHHWHEEPNGALPTAVYEEAVEVLAVPHGEQLELEL